MEVHSGQTAQNRQQLEDVRKNAKALREQSDQLLLRVRQLLHDSAQRSSDPTMLAGEEVARMERHRDREAFDQRKERRWDSVHILREQCEQMRSVVLERRSIAQKRLEDLALIKHESESSGSAHQGTRHVVMDAKG